MDMEFEDPGGPVSPAAENKRKNPLLITHRRQKVASDEKHEGEEGSR